MFYIKGDSNFHSLTNFQYLFFSDWDSWAYPGTQAQRQENTLDGMPVKLNYKQ